MIGGEAFDEEHDQPSEATHAGGQMYTAGYREGITQTDPQTIQDGFDTGFNLSQLSCTMEGCLLGILKDSKKSLDAVDDREQAPDKQEAVRQLNSLEKKLKNLNTPFDTLLGTTETLPQVKEAHKRAQTALGEVIEMTERTGERAESHTL